MDISLNKISKTLSQLAPLDKIPKAKSAEFNISDSNLKKYSDAVTSLCKAQLNVPSKKDDSKLPLLFLPESLSRKEFYAKHNEFNFYIKKLSPEQKIIKDSYSAEDLLGKLYTADEFIHSDKGFTDAICDCICVLLNNKEDGYLLHLCPGKHKKPSQIKHMQEKISSFVDDLSRNGENCSAFLFGGRKNASEELHSNILDILTKKRLKPDEVLYDKAYDPHTFFYDVKKGIVIDKYLSFDFECLQESFEKVNISKK